MRNSEWRRTRVSLWLLALALLAVWPGRASASESWLGLFLAGRKMGYSWTKIGTATHQGKPARKVESFTQTRLELFGNSVEQRIRSTTLTDLRYVPITQEYQLESNGTVTRLQASYTSTQIKCKVTSGGSTSVRELAIPAGAMLTIDSSSIGMGKPLEVGQKSTFYYLEPMRIALERSDTEVVAREEVKLGGKTISAYRITATSPIGPLTIWQDGQEPLRIQAPLGITMCRLTREEALAPSTAEPLFEVAGTAPAAAYSPADFAIATAIVPPSPIEKPRELRELRMTVSGIAESRLAISDNRQKAAPVEGRPGTYQYTITVGDFEAASAARLPVQRADMEPYLATAPYLEKDAPAIRKAAAEIARGETNSYRVAARIRKWVHERMRPDYSIGVPRSCTDILKNPRGVCRDYATLFAGIARAAGIPARVVGGIVYGEGRFYYHAWVECWVGDWVAFDATLPSDFTDATHVKFSQGDVTDMYQVAAVIGRIKIEDLTTR